MIPVRKPGRRAFSLLEVLLALAIVGLLIGLTLAAVQKARAAGARQQSMDNLRQIALATQQFDQAHGALPDYATGISDSPASLAFSTTFVKILPYVGEESLHAAALARGAAALNGKVVKLYLSPCDTSSPSPFNWTSYVVNWNAVGEPGLSLGRSFTDGTGTTILFTERYRACGDPRVYNAWAVHADGQAVNGIASTRTATLDGDTLPQFAPAVSECVPGGASAPDPRAILTAMADGSVRPITRDQARGPTANPSTGVNNWQAALTLRRGEQLGPDW